MHGDGRIEAPGQPGGQGQRVPAEAPGNGFGDQAEGRDLHLAAQVGFELGQAGAAVPHRMIHCHRRGSDNHSSHCSSDQERLGQ